ISSMSKANISVHIFHVSQHPGETHVYTTVASPVPSLNPLASSTAPACAFQEVTGRLLTMSQMTIHPPGSPEMSRKLLAKRCKAWIGVACPRRIYVGVAGGCWVFLYGTSLIFVLEARSRA